MLSRRSVPIRSALTVNLQAALMLLHQAPGSLAASYKTPPGKGAGGKGCRSRSPRSLVVVCEQAFEEMAAEYGLQPPKITFIVVQKRHGTRFFPVNFGDGDKKGNILPGEGG